MKSNTAQIATEAALSALGRQNPRFNLYRGQDPSFRQADVDFWTSEFKTAIKKAQSDDTKRLDYISTGLYEIRKSKRGWAILKGFTNYEYDLHPTLREAIDAAMRKDK